MEIQSPSLGPFALRPSQQDLLDPAKDEAEFSSPEELSVLWWGKGGDRHCSISRVGVRKRRTSIRSSWGLAFNEAFISEDP